MRGPSSRFTAEEMAGLRLRRPWSSTAAVEWRGGPGAHVNLCMASAWPAVAYSGPAMHMHGAQRRSSYDGGTMVATVIGKRAREGRRELGKEVPRSAWSGGAQRRGGTAALQAQRWRRTEQATPAARRLYVRWGRRRKERGTSGMAWQGGGWRLERE